MTDTIIDTVDVTYRGGPLDGSTRPTDRTAAAKAAADPLYRFGKYYPDTAGGFSVDVYWSHADFAAEDRANRYVLDPDTMTATWRPTTTAERLAGRAAEGEWSRLMRVVRPATDWSWQAGFTATQQVRGRNDLTGAAKRRLRHEIARNHMIIKMAVPAGDVFTIGETIPAAVSHVVDVDDFLWVRLAGGGWYRPDIDPYRSCRTGPSPALPVQTEARMLAEYGPVRVFDPSRIGDADHATIALLVPANR